MNEQLELASVSEPSKQLEIKPSEIIITTNLEGLEKYITELVKPFEEGKIDVSTKDLETYARGVLADLNKIIKDIDTERKLRIKEISAPITQVDSAVKKIIERAQAAYRKSKDVIDAKVEAARREREEVLRIDYEGSVGEKTAAKIPFEKIANKSWFTSSYGDVKAENELAEKCSQITREMKVIDQAALVNRNEVIAHYCEHVDLTAALEYDNVLTERQREADRIASEAAEAFSLKGSSGTCIIKPMQTSRPEPEPAAKDVEHETGTFVLNMPDVAQLDAVEVARYAEKLLGFKPELKKVSK